MTILTVEQLNKLPKCYNCKTLMKGGTVCDYCMSPERFRLDPLPRWRMTGPEVVLEENIEHHKKYESQKGGHCIFINCDRSAATKRLCHKHYVAVHRNRVNKTSFSPIPECSFCSKNEFKSRRRLSFVYYTNGEISCIYCRKMGKAPKAGRVT
jgi:hypothetical protein